MRTANGITFLAGLLVVLSYAAGAAVRSAIVRAGADGPLDDGDRPIADRRAVVAEVAVSLLCAGIAYLVIDELAPGSTSFRNSSAVGFLSPKTLTVWESIALWSGLGAIIGAVAPAPMRFRHGTTGVAGAAAMLALWFPATFLIALGTWAVGIGIVRDVRTTLPLVFVAVAGAEWLMSMTKVRVGWGLIHGPESVIWVAVLAGVLVSRWSHDAPSDASNP